MKLKCLVIDDEPLSQEVIADFIHSSPELELVAVLGDALKAGEVLKQDEIQLLFLDINMPRLSGIGLMRSLKEPPLVIFVTAYPQYAVEGFEVDAVDYLLKPVSFERFRLAVNRAVDRFKQKPENKTSHLILRSNKKDYRVTFDEIKYLEACGDYVRFGLNDQTLMVHGRLKDFLARLPEEDFVQIHKSWAISLSKVQYLEGNQVLVADKRIPVSIKYKEALHEKLHF